MSRTIAEWKSYFRGKPANLKYIEVVSEFISMIRPDIEQDLERYTQCDVRKTVAEMRYQRYTESECGYRLAPLYAYIKWKLPCDILAEVIEMAFPDVVRDYLDGCFGFYIEVKEDDTPMEFYVSRVTPLLYDFCRYETLSLWAEIAVSNLKEEDPERLALYICNRYRNDLPSFVKLMKLWLQKKAMCNTEFADVICHLERLLDGLEGAEVPPIEFIDDDDSPKTALDLLELTASISSKLTASISSKLTTSISSKLTTSISAEQQPNTPECVICFDAKPTYAVVPCGHMCFCQNCCNSDAKKELCPICRQPTERIIKIYQ